jgi:hypothetical protein
MNPRLFNFSVGVARDAYLLGIEGLFTQASRPDRTFGESVDGFLDTDISVWSNGNRYHVFGARSDTEFV